MIIVTGATGQLGPLVIDQLLARGPSSGIVASARRPEKATGLAERGVDVRRGDFSEPETLPTAFAGASQVLVVSTDTIGAEALAFHKAAIGAAREAGASRVLYTSHMGARSESAFAPMPDHAATEAMLEEGGIAWTSLRHGFYASSALQLIEWGLASGTIALPEDGKISWTTHEDLAEADAIVLTEEGGLDGITPPLTAPEAFDMADLATIASEITGREVKRVTVSDRQYRETLMGHGLPEFRADVLVGIFQAARRGDFAATGPMLGELIGRPPKTMHDVLAAKLGN